MPALVKTEHPTGLTEPKLLGKTINGTQKVNGQDSPATNGHTNLQDKIVNGNGNVDSLKERLQEDDRAVLALRNLIFDICNQNGGGHGGSAIGMAAIGVALYKYVMRYNPSDPSWFDRDRFVLSNGKWLDTRHQRNQLTTC